MRSLMARGGRSVGLMSWLVWWRRLLVGGKRESGDVDGMNRSYSRRGIFVL